MNTLQELMVITMEECGELTQVCSKTIRKFEEITDVDEDQRQKIIEEAGDIYCMLTLMMTKGLFSQEEMFARAQVKAEKLKKWSNLYGMDE